jgi:hypothetical protein
MHNFGPFGWSFPLKRHFGGHKNFNTCSFCIFFKIIFEWGLDVTMHQIVCAILHYNMFAYSVEKDLKSFINSKHFIQDTFYHYKALYMTSENLSVLAKI